MSRLAGISLIVLGIACWPDNTTHRALYGTLTYSMLAMLYLAYVVVIEMVGVGLPILLVRAWRKEQKPPAPGTYATIRASCSPCS